jgi:hypothetical protein
MIVWVFMIKEVQINMCMISDFYEFMTAWNLEQKVNLLKTYKGKAVPLQAWTGPEGSRRSRLPDF